MTVTIITPAFNAGRYIVETVNSVLKARDSSDIEYIVLDDGSTDDTVDKLKPYFDRLTVVSHTNMGEQATVNKGIAMAKNDIVAIINADDPIYPDLIRIAVKILNINPQLVAVYPDWHKIDRNGNIIERMETCDFDYNLMLEQYRCIPGPGTFFRKSALNGELPRNPLYRYSGDFDLWLRLGLKGPMGRIPMFLATWRHHEEGASQMKISQEMADNRIAVMKSFFSRTDLPFLIREKKRQALSAAYYQAGVLALHNSSISGRRYLLMSFIYKLIWPKRFLKSNQRDWRYILYIFGAPFTTLGYKLLRFIRNNRKVYV